MKILIISFFVLISNCYLNAQNNFLRDGTSFSYAPNWEITEQDDLYGQGYYLSVEKNELDGSGLFMVTWISELIDLHEYMVMMQNEFKAESLFQDLRFQPAQKSFFNRISTLSSGFTFTVLGIEHQAVIHFFQHKGRTFYLIKQEAIEDIIHNKEGFELIESTFTVN